MIKLKNSEIHFRVTLEDKTIIENKAKMVGMSISEFIIDSVKRKRIVVIDDIPKIVSDVHGAAVNINQIAKVANSQKFVNKKNVEDLFLESQTLQNQIKELIKSIYEYEPEHENVNAQKIYHTLSVISQRIDRIEKSLVGIE